MSKKVRFGNIFKFDGREYREMEEYLLREFMTGGIIMIRKAFKMKIFEESHEEYKRRHDEIWKSLIKILKIHGAHNYSIFLDEETSKLFAYLEIESEELWDKVAYTEECKKWWSFMKDIMETNEDNSPKAIELKSVFYLR